MLVWRLDLAWKSGHPNQCLRLGDNTKTDRTLRARFCESASYSGPLSIRAKTSFLSEHCLTRASAGLASPAREMGHDKLSIKSLKQLSHAERRACAPLRTLGVSTFRIRAALYRSAVFCSQNFADRRRDSENSGPFTLALSELSQPTKSQTRANRRKLHAAISVLWSDR